MHPLSSGKKCESAQMHFPGLFLSFFLSFCLGLSCPGFVLKVTVGGVGGGRGRGKTFSRPGAKISRSAETDFFLSLLFSADNDLLSPLFSLFSSFLWSGKRGIIYVLEANIRRQEFSTRKRGPCGVQGGKARGRIISFPVNFRRKKRPREKKEKRNAQCY